MELPPVDPALSEEYDLLEALSPGAEPSVFRAYQRGLARFVAIKFMRTDGRDAAEARRRFASEARIVARLRHPNIIAVHDMALDREVPFIVMDLVDGETVQARLDRVGGLGLPEVFVIAMSTMDAVAYLHSEGVVHGNLKPENLLLDGEGNVSLIDFGLATAPDFPLGRRAAGSPAYMAPERFLGLPVEPAADIYALGVILFELLVGRPPFLARDLAGLRRLHEEGPVPSIRERHRNVPEQLERVVIRAMAKQPSSRYRAVAQMYQHLHELVTFAQIWSEQPGLVNPRALLSDEVASLPVSISTSLDAIRIEELRDGDPDPAPWSGDPAGPFLSPPPPDTDPRPPGASPPIPSPIPTIVPSVLPSAASVAHPDPRSFRPSSTDPALTGLPSLSPLTLPPPPARPRSPTHRASPPPAPPVRMSPLALPLTTIPVVWFALAALIVAPGTPGARESPAGNPGGITVELGEAPAAGSMRLSVDRIRIEGAGNRRLHLGPEEGRLLHLIAGDEGLSLDTASRKIRARHPLGSPGTVHLRLEGVFWIGSGGTVLRTSREDGRTLARVELGEPVAVPPVFGSGAVHVVAGRSLRELDPVTLEERRRIELAGPAAGRLARDRDRIYVAAGTELRGIPADPTARAWRTVLPGEVSAGPVLRRDEVITGMADGSLWTVDAASGEPSGAPVRTPHGPVSEIRVDRDDLMILWRTRLERMVAGASEPAWSLPVASPPVAGLHVGPVTVVVATRDGSLRVHRLADGSLVHRIVTGGGIDDWRTAGGTILVARSPGEVLRIR